MSDLFLSVLNLSITAGWLILAIVIIRPFMKRAPKWLNCALWGLVAIRLICPFSFESRTSLIPNSEPVPHDIVMNQTPEIDSGLPVLNNVINPIIADNFAPDPIDSVNPLQIVVFAGSVLWIAGIIGLFLYALISFYKLKKSVGVSVAMERDVFACDEVKSPFILGVIRPVIYVPSSLGGASLDYVIAHEKTHIKRGDHFWKPLGYALLMVYWFNPLCWLAYILLCRDIELACDERVIKDFDKEGKAAYSQALLNCSFSRKKIAACPLAFGEVGVKERVKNVLNYKKPAFWIICISIVTCAVLVVCFLTNPKKNNAGETVSDTESAREIDTEETDTKENDVEEPEVETTDTDADIPNNYTVAESFGNSVKEYPKWDDFGFDCWPLALGDLLSEWSEDMPFWRFITPKGTEVYAVKDGTVIGGYNYNDGYYIILSIDDAEGTYIKYSHLDTMNYEKQEYVTAGTEIGTVGATGRATGPFLKVEIGSNALANRIIRSAETIQRPFYFAGYTGNLIIDVTEEAISQPVEMDLCLQDNSGKTVWKTGLAIPSAGWNSYYVYSSEEEDYLIQYYPSVAQGMTAYSFVVYRFDAKGDTIKVFERYANSQEEVPEFLEDTKQYFDKAKLFISTLNGVVKTGM